MLRCALVLLLTTTLAAADPRLEAIRQLLDQIRNEPRKPPPERGTPLMTPVKHQLRAWIAARLPPPSEFTASTGQRINAELSAA